MRTSPCALNSPPRWNGGLLGWLVRTGFPGDGAGLLAESTNGGYVDLCCLFTPGDGAGNRRKPYGLCSFPLAKSITPAIVAGDGNGTYCK